jgi:hypothetical protein
METGHWQNYKKKLHMNYLFEVLTAHTDEGDRSSDPESCSALRMNAAKSLIG